MGQWWKSGHSPLSGVGSHTPLGRDRQARLLSETAASSLITRHTKEAFVSVFQRAPRRGGISKTADSGTNFHFLPSRDKVSCWLSRNERPAQQMQWINQRHTNRQKSLTPTGENCYEKGAPEIPFLQSFWIVQTRSAHCLSTPYAQPHFIDI